MAMDVARLDSLIEVTPVIGMADARACWAMPSVHAVAVEA